MRTRTTLFTATATLVLCAGVVLSGCSSAAAAAESAALGDVAGPRGASGTRLRAKFIEGGGARELVGFVDTARSEDCTFQRAADGRLLCLPRAVQGSVGNGFFGDAACKVPIGFVPTCASDVGYLTELAGNNCGATSASSMRRVLRPATTIYAQTSDGCNLQPASTTGPGAVEVGEPVPFDQFVAAEESDVANGGLTARFAVATDGARALLGHRLDAFGTDCTMQIMADGATRCVPTASDGQLFYGDSECMRANYTFPLSSGNGCGPDGSLVRDMTRAGCRATRAIYTVATGVDVSAPDDTLYAASPSSSSSSSATSTCTSTSSPSRSPLRSITDVTAKLPSIERVGKGGGRLVPAFVAGATGERLVAGFHDKEKNVDCAFAKATDGKLRCLPAGPNGLVFFTDTSCTSPGRVAARAGEVACGDTALRFVRVAETATACVNGPVQTGPRSVDDTIQRVYELNGDVRAVTGGSWASGPGRCSQIQSINGVVDAVEVDPAGYVEGTFVTE